MPVRSFTPVLLCSFLLWRILTAVSSHPHQSSCQLIHRTALYNGCELSSVPADLPDDIEELQLNYNNITTLRNSSLLRYPALNTLSLTCNNLENLESNTFQDSKLLVILNLANNNLYVGYQETSRALKKLPVLRNLDLSQNNLNEMMASTLLQNLSSLEYLNLSGNLLQRLDETSFRDLHQLKELDLQGNIIFEIDSAFDSNPKLQRLNLAFNLLPCLTDFHMTQLVVLNVSHNFIEWFISRQDLNETFQLETLDLSKNKLIFFPFLPSYSNLRYLYLSHNAVRFYEHLSDNVTAPNSSKTVEFYNLREYMVNVTAQLWDEDLHGDISNLEILDLRVNQVSYFPQGFIQKMPGLLRLQIGTNCLEILNLTSQGFSSSLHELDVSNNRLNQIFADDDTLTSLENLTFFNLSWNDLKHLPFGLFSSLPSIWSVDVSYNNVVFCHSEDAEITTQSDTACVDWRNIMSLRQLYLKGCNLKRIPTVMFAGLALTHLELSDNPGLIVQDSLRSLSRTLQHLDLGNTQTQNVDFSHFHSLRSLNLSRNSLPQIPSSLRDINLRSLDIRDNNLSTIPAALADALASKLQTIFLTGNPFNCCQTDWYQMFRRTMTVDLVGHSDIKCVDHFQQTHRVKDYRLPCQEAGESLLWYFLLFVPVCISFLGILFIVFLTFKPRIIEQSIKKNYLKPTSY
ncbi:transforming growth factor beta activator LRRC33 [Cololabis saira]|uniref:transforming growth factor beta activator LRRC33 n=1 Tax=Cololabis saira TaxID=129043 RepID=UPI002AD5739F|nr:transforming growth factor beta activator LRRC33 [Cololabis saira]